MTAQEDLEAEIIQDKLSREELRKDQEAADLQALLGTRGGRAFNWRLLSQCGIYQSSLSENIVEMAAKEGRRNVGLWVLNEVKIASMDALVTMEQEEKFAREEEQRLEDAARVGSI